MFYDPTFILLIPALLLAFYAQWKVKSTYAKYSEVACSRGYTGAQVARYILDDFRLQDIAIESTPGELSDHYDPRDRKLRLSQRVYESNSVAAIGVAAHEAGHAIQDAKSYVPLKLRNGLVPMTNLGTTMAFPLFILGMFAVMTAIGLYFMARRVWDIGVVCLMVGTGIPGLALLTVFGVITNWWGLVGAIVLVPFVTSGLVHLLTWISPGRTVPPAFANR